MANPQIVDNGWLDEEDPTTPWYPKARRRVFLEIEVTLASESQFFAGLRGDVSEGGVFIQTYRRLAIGDCVALSLTLPTGNVDGLGVVEWIREADAHMSPGVGVVFERLSPRVQACIADFCRSRPPLYHDDGAS